MFDKSTSFACEDAEWEYDSRISVVVSIGYKYLCRASAEALQERRALI
jgi:hypothetical protein